MIDWLLSPLSGAATHHIAPWTSWHARAMVLSWAVLLPLGVFAARFFKTTRRWPHQLDSKPWWLAHRSLQYSGIALMSVGVALAWSQGAAATDIARLHAWAGWAVCTLGWLQVAGGLARGSKGGPTDAQMRGDHYDMTPWRRAFERTHKSLGWLALLGSVVVITLGLSIVDAPRWMLLSLALWWLTLTTAFAVLQTRGRCIDTYQAIWGPSRAHPGNRMPPIGWGVRRPLG
jgi:hypothetical protein